MRVSKMLAAVALTIAASAGTVAYGTALAHAQAVHHVAARR